MASTCTVIKLHVWIYAIKTNKQTTKKFEIQKLWKEKNKRNLGKVLRPTSCSHLSCGRNI